MVAFANVLLAPLLTLDPKGGFSKRVHMESMWEAVYNESRVGEYVDAMVARCNSGSKQNLKEREAYGYRVMLSHVREKAERHRSLKGTPSDKSHPDELIKLYGLITVKAAATPQEKPHPFFAFRPVEADADDEI